ncbi:hypothetical protein AVEN_248794-1 [Araneus ventricosus]|uniref:Uncharacterized protein n=1 Tax=Araneus ventricosus TaxID=182803 RepID=A0A4Y2AX48_ARAVE|nr:hypothetical protein AVEN_248794-1 [Araneus ventricosus]
MWRTVIWQWHAVQRGAGSPNNRCLCVNRVCPIRNLNKPQDDSDLEETDEPENVLVSHSEAANALEIALRYIEQNENATSTDMMFMRRWRNIVSESRITSLRQTNFFTRKDR